MNVVSLVRRFVDRYPAMLRVRELAIVDAIWPRIIEWQNGRVYRSAYSRLRANETRQPPAVTQLPGLLSLVSTVYNTPPQFLGILAESVRQQQGGTHFEWLILDNGTTNVETRWLLRELARWPFVRLERAEQNLGIIGGMRWCLENASGRYTMPLDSDDYLYSDCILRVTEAIRANKYPPLLYTDEDLLMDERVYETYHKPGWDPVLFSDSCYVAHMGVIERSFALELGAYTDHAVEGSHDWDTFTRFINAGVEPVHVPHVLYSWRMHPHSTSAAIHSKPYVFDSQKTVLTRFLQGLPRPERFWLDKSPLFSNTPDWWIRTAETKPRPIHVVQLGGAAASQSETSEADGFPLKVLGAVDDDGTLQELGARVAEIEPEGLVCLAWDRLVHDRTEWAWDAYTYLECFSDAAAIGGPVFGPGGHVVCAGIVFGYGRGLDSPDRGRLRGNPGFFAQMWKHRSVAAVSAQNVVVRQDFLAKVLAMPECEGFGMRMLGPLIGAAAWRAGMRVIYSPFMSCTAQGDWDEGIAQADIDRFLRTFPDLVPDDRYYSPTLSLAAGNAYRVASPQERRTHVERLIGVAGWHAALGGGRPIEKKGEVA